MRKGIIMAAVVFAAFACFAQKQQAGKAAATGTEGHGYQWAVRNGDAWKWVSVPLSAEEQESLNQAIQQAGGLNANTHVHMVAKGNKLSFQADTGNKESADQLTKQALFKSGEQRFRVVPEGNSYMVLKGRMEKAAA